MRPGRLSPSEVIFLPIGAADARAHHRQSLRGDWYARGNTKCGFARTRVKSRQKYLKRCAIHDRHQHLRPVGAPGKYAYLCISFPSSTLVITTSFHSGYGIGMSTYVFRIPTGFHIIAQDCGIPLPWVSDASPSLFSTPTELRRFFHTAFALM